MVVVYYIWKVIYSTGNFSVLEGFTLSEMIAYIILSFGTSQAINNGTVWIIASEVRDGTIVMNLIKPINYHLRIFFGVLGDTLLMFVLMLLPASIILSALSIGGGVVNTVLFVISLFLSIVIGFLFDFLFGMLAFYIQNLWGIGFGKIAIVRLFSGAMIPLAFFPDAIQRFLEFLPFKSMVYTPIMIFLGKYHSNELVYVFAQQLFWIGIFAILNYMSWKKAINRLTIQGG